MKTIHLCRIWLAWAVLSALPMVASATMDLSFGPPSGPHGQRIDVNADGRPDLVYRTTVFIDDECYDAPGFAVQLDMGNGQFSPAQSYAIEIAGCLDHLWVSLGSHGDIGADGFIDFVIQRS
jgi:hypothetical protein